MKVTLGNVLTFVVLLPTWHLIFLLFGLYESKRLASRSSEMIDTAKATTLVAISLLFASSLFHIRMVNFSFAMLYWCVSTISIAFGRFAVRLVGSGACGRTAETFTTFSSSAPMNEPPPLRSRIEAQSELGYRLLGFRR